MSYDDKFPPNVWLKKTIMKTPGRFMLYVLGFIVLELVCGYYFPHQVSSIATVMLFILMPLSLAGTIWHLVWSLKHRPPPPQYCETCHQRLPYKDDQ